MKKCDSCSKEFQLITKGSGGHNRRYCYECYPEGLTKSERGNLRNELLRRKVEKEKVETGCKICGYNKSHVALEWHHLDDDKMDNPSDLIKISLKRYYEEIEKCVLLCSNCHREVHAGVTELKV
jgi:hypothetical protein